MSTGSYYRFGLHNERAHRQSILLQRSRNGRPVYVESADFTDWARIIRKQINRVARLHRRGVNGEGAWALLPDPSSPNNNFWIGGGENTDATAKEAWVGGFCALMHRTVSFDALRSGEFSELDAACIHHKATSTAAGQIVDRKSKFGINALVGFTVHVEGAGDFEVSSNTATVIHLDGFDPADYPDLPARPWYWVPPQTLEAETECQVYLDVHLEDWGMEEDPALNHNAGGSPVECARREVLVRKVWIRQNTTTPELPIEDYVDATQAQHYVLYLGSITRRADVDAIAEEDIDLEDVEIFAASGDELDLARDFAHFDVGADHDDDGEFPLQPRNLAERLSREDSWIVVGPTGDPGIYTGHLGLQDALELPGTHTIFLRNGIYPISKDLVISSRFTIIGESKQAIISFNTTSYGITVEGRARLENLTIQASGSADRACVFLGRNAVVDSCWFYHGGSSSHPFVRVTRDASTGGGGTVFRDCQFRGSGPLLRVESESTSARASSMDVTGTSPLAADNTASTRHLLGVDFERCKFYRTSSAGANPDEANTAAVQVRGGGDLGFSRCFFAGLDAPVLHVGYANFKDNADYIGQVTLDRCHFLALCVAGSAYTTASLVNHTSGYAAFLDCSWSSTRPLGDDSPGPRRLLETYLSGDRNGGLSIKGGRMLVRGNDDAFQLLAGLSVRITGSGMQASVDGLELWQEDLRIGALAFSSCTSEESSITFSNVMCSISNATNAIWWSGNTHLHNIEVNSSRMSSDPETNVATCTSVAALLFTTTDVFGDLTHDLPLRPSGSSLRVIRHPYAGVAARGAGVSGSTEVQLSDLVVDGLFNGSAVTSYGIIVRNIRGAEIRGAHISGVQFTGVYDEDHITRMSGISVSGFAEAYRNSENYGLFSEGSGAPAWEAAAQPYVERKSGVYGAKSISGLRVFPCPELSNRSGAIALTMLPGHLGPVHASVEQVEGATVGAWLTAIGAAGTLTYPTLTIKASDCEVGVFVESGVSRLRLTAEMSGCGTALTAWGLAGARLDLDSRSPFSSGYHGVYLSACSQTRLSGLVEGGETQLSATNCSNLTLAALELHTASLSPAVLTSVTSLRMTDVGVFNNGQFDTKSFDTSVRQHSLVVISCADIQAQRAYFSHGVFAVDCLATLHFESCEAAAGGFVVTPLEAAPCHLKLTDCRSTGSSSGTVHVVSALWAANLNASGSLGSVVVRGGILTRGSQQVENFDLAVDTNVRAGRYVAAYSNALDNVFDGVEFQNGNGIHGLLIGNLNSIQDADSAAPDDDFRVGVARARVRNCRFESAADPALVLLVRDGLCHEVSGNTFEVYSNQAEYDSHQAPHVAIRIYSENESDAYARVIYTNNHHFRGDRWNEGSDTSVDLKVLTSANILLDAGLSLGDTGEWHEWSGMSTEERNVAIRRLNSVTLSSESIQADGTIS